MSAAAATEIELAEFQPMTVRRAEIPAALGELLHHTHGKLVDVEFPSPRTGGQWRLTSRGWVGYLPLSREIALRLQPKVPLSNLFRMLEVAYRLKGFEFLPGLAPCRSLEDYFERLANVLALRVLDRGRRGFHRDYVGRDERLGFVRGRIDLERAARAPWRVRLDCRFHDHTADVEDNQILAWTLSRVSRSGACRRPEVRSTVRKAFRAVQSVALPIPFAARECADRLYHRLNEDYRPLHALCRFFLEHSGPRHDRGDRASLPFLVDMAGLFELFVTEWLRRNLPPELQVRAQVPAPIGDGLSFRIDLVIFSRVTGRALAVLDTKYKTPNAPAGADVSQVVAYAVSQGCQEAALVYPTAPGRGLDGRVGEIRVRSLVFSLTKDLEIAGRAFLAELLEHVDPS